MTNLATGRYTWDDFIDLSEDDPRELIDAGSLRESEVFRPDSFEGLEIPLPELWT
jgi:hypothetical protein